VPLPLFVPLCTSVMGIYIPESHLPNLKLYKYNGIDHSLLSRYILQPYWNRLVLLFPTWMAPNLITLLGFSCVLVNIITLFVLDPELDGIEGPSAKWVYWSWALGLFIYQSLDAIDGKQARRTGTSGPLGELFDHGCDALNTSLGALLVAAATGIQGWLAALSLFAAHSNFYITTWDEYHTGSLYLAEISGPVEGVVIIIGVFFLTGLKGGPKFWSQGFKTMFGIESILPGVPNIPVKYILVGISFIVMVVNILSSFRNVARVMREQNKPLYLAAIRLMPYFPLPIMASLWFYLSPSILQHHLSYVVVYLGFAFSYTVGRMIVAYVARYRYPRSNVILAPMGIWITNVMIQRYLGFPLIPLHYETLWVYGSIAYGAFVYLHFALDVITEICRYFDIWCLSIKPKKKE